MKLNNYKYLFGLESGFSVNSLFLICSCLLSMFPILSFGIRSILIAVWGFLGILCLIKNYSFPRIIDKTDKFIIAFLSISFVFLIFSLLYTENIPDGVKRLLRMFPIVLIPTIFYLNKQVFTKQRIDWITNLFCLSVLVFVIYQVLCLGFNFDILTNDLSIAEIKRNNLHHLSNISQDQIQQVKIRRLRNFITKLVDSHPIYQGLWMSFVIYFNYHQLKFRSHSVLQKIVKIFIICLMLFWMVLISSRMPLIATFIAGIMTMILFKYYNLKKVTLLGGIFLGCFCILLVTLKPIQTRFIEILDNIFILPTTGNDIYNYNSTNVRVGIYYCSGIVAKDNWLFGLGIGDVQENLSNCYDQKIGAEIYQWKDYNSHNQYFFFLLSAGIVGLITFLMFLIFLIKKTFLIEKSVLFYFVLISSIVFITENLLSRSDGVLFFSLFVSLILLSTNDINKCHETLDG
ncbi:O-antigen ligase family protein [Aquimarina sp. MMG015]|uniref:O-antigen ligase family protein n=1 Tax=Aquimarina sp. MMG015 TaxID=2822689 RepID=UPI001B3A1A2D|nr:O-antigen ligase family protein [Aquimarina sp. MMG015]MBQ4801398.1 O-antigen ligase family protein [Aquimarina sp. MMG015]